MSQIDFTKKQKTLTFKNSNFSLDNIRQVSENIYIEAITFENCAITDNNLMLLSKSPTIKSITLIHSIGFSDNAFLQLATMQRLTTLNIINSPITEKGISYFEKNKQLKTLRIQGIIVKDEIFLTIAKIPSLKELFIEDVTMTVENLLTLANNPSINIFYYGKAFTDEHYKLFERQQVKLALNNKPIDNQAAIMAQQRLLSFFADMMNWAKAFSKIETEIQDYDKEYKDFRQQSMAACRVIFEKHCTNKSHSGGTLDGVVAIPTGPNYYYNATEIIATEQISPIKIIFYTQWKLETFFHAERFTLLKVKNDWRIDSKQRLSSGWQKDYL